METRQTDARDLIGQLNSELEDKLNALVGSLDLQKIFRFSVYTFFVELTTADYGAIITMDAGSMGNYDTLQCKFIESAVCDFQELGVYLDGFSRIVAEMKRTGLDVEAVKVLKRTIKLDLYAEIMDTYK